MHVLYVDDEPDIREVAEIALSLDPQFSVKAVASAREALEYLATRVPDIALFDVMMPEMDGPSLLQEIRRDPRLVDLPVIFVTARAQRSDLQNFSMLDACGVIAKPFDPLSLAAQVRAMKP
jgi:CheY-like chemotaxis protein